MVVQVLDFMVRVIRGTAPDQDIGAITMVIKTGPVIKIIKGVTITKAISNMAKVVTITKTTNSRARVITTIKAINSVSSSSNPGIRVTQSS